MEKTVLYENIDRLVQYGLTTGLTSEEEEIYTRNQLLEVFGEEDYQENDKTGKEVRTEELEDILKNLLDYAAECVGNIGNFQPGKLTGCQNLRQLFPCCVQQG